MARILSLALALPLAVLALAGAAPQGAASADEAKKPAAAAAAANKKKLLVITESRGFVHDVVRRPKGGSPCLVEKVLAEVGGKSGDFETVNSQSARKDITAENLKKFDAVFFYTTGDLGLSDTQKADLINFVRKGGGFAGSHSATDTYYNWPEYGKLIGGYFNGHPWHEKVRVIVEDTQHPATKHLGASFDITDEIYQFRAPYDRGKLRVLMRLSSSANRAVTRLNGKEVTDKDALSLTVSGGKATAKLNGQDVEVKNFRYDGPRGARSDGDNALAWVQEYGKGRVFYTALGHRDDVWKDPRFQKHMHGGLRYVLGLEKADATPQPATPER